ncbi:thiamine pyrophosphate-dependent enzyme [Streptomyces chartreusis]|uniref:thiamine pyrophosphate-dependent enzyme n=1 Tax=Streptomyces chartreusis TaxID=1969 RepID=UPI0038094C5C
MIHSETSMPLSADSGIGAQAPSVAEALVEALSELGICAAFGVSGGAVAPLWDALTRSRKIEVLHFRHEAGAAFAAAETYFAGGHAAAVCVTSGPGITNALTGMLAARGDGAKTILISGSTPQPQRDRGAFQETSPQALGADVFCVGPLFHYAAEVHTAEDLGEARNQLAEGLGRPGGFVAHLSLSPATQKSRFLCSLSGAPAWPGTSTSVSVPRAPDHTVRACADILATERVALWVGFGARHAAPEVAVLAKRLGAPVFCTPRGKGIFPENHPRFVGVTGLGSDHSVTDFLADAGVERILVLGSRLGEMTSFWHPGLVPDKGFIHVDIDPDVPGKAYPDAHTVAVHADIRAFLSDVLELIPAGRVPLGPSFPAARHAATASDRDRGDLHGVRPQVLMTAVQRLVVEESDAVVLTEAGNAFAWGTLGLRFPTPGRYRVSTGFGSMGHAATGVLGAAYATRSKAVALVGDGSMLMNCEISTAVQYGIPAVWIVLNDAGYGMIRQGMSGLGLTVSPDFDVPPTDFAQLARAMGADGLRVTSEDDLPTALATAMRAASPFVLDVLVDPTCKAPIGNRVANLATHEAEEKL